MLFLKIGIRSQHLFPRNSTDWSCLVLKLPQRDCMWETQKSGGVLQILDAQKFPYNACDLDSFFTWTSTFGSHTTILVSLPINDDMPSLSEIEDQPSQWQHQSWRKKAVNMFIIFVTTWPVFNLLIDVDCALPMTEKFASNLRQYCL